MTRPWVIWVTALACVLIVFGAVGTMTHITVTMEEEIYVKSEYDSRVKNAVDQMDEYVEALLSRENSRPAADFSPIQTRFNQVAGNRDIMVGNDLSPLFAEQPDNVKFYWFSDLDNRLPTRQLASPQLPAWGALEDISPNNENRQYLEENLEVHTQLSSILNSSSEWSISQSKKKEDAQKYGVTNLGQVNYAAVCASVHYDQGNMLDNKQVQDQLAQAVSNTNAWAKDEKKDEAVLSRKLKHITRAASYSNKGRAKVAKEPEQQQLQDAPQNSKYDYNSNVFNGNVFKAPQIETNPYFGVFDGAEVSPFTALWVNSELMLVRKVITTSGNFVQGIWLDKEKIYQDLMGLGQTFLPNISLQETLNPVDFKSLSYGPDDIHALEKIPFKVVPGVIPLDYGRVTPMRVILAIAWACVILAVVAVLIMFKGVMKLSERRASFVSSVSHELRTPLTTFKLYSEMLADGMVKDPNKQQEYLDTLTKESDRLTHMVENVLSFSRIERGKAQRELSAVNIGSLIGQLEPCLRMRLADEGMTWQNDLSTEAADSEVLVDPTSLDQILTNLVDNAAKYGQNETGDSVVRISGEIVAKFLHLRISDDGPGIDPSQEKRLFKAFHKSDIEAAHTKPGVGLGLALCRSLARSMGGDLLVGRCPSQSQGACIELRLPLAG